VRKEWNPLPTSFQWQRKARRYLSGFLNFLAFVFGWAGLWDLFDIQILERSLPRDLIFLFVPLTLGITFEIFLSEESLLFLFAYLRSQGWQKVSKVTNIKENLTIDAEDNTGHVVLEMDKASGNR